MRLSTLAIPLLTAAYASAHGYVSQLSIGDTLYQGDRTGQPTDNSVIRDVSSQDPIKGADNPDLNCGNGSPRPAGLNADAKPGDTMSFLWVSADGGNVSLPSLNLPLHDVKVLFLNSGLMILDL